MVIIVHDENQHLVFIYDDSDNNELNIQEAYNVIKNHSITDGDLFKQHLYITKDYLKRTYHLFFNDTKNKKEARYRARILTKGINDFEKVGSRINDLSINIEDSISHNTRNIIHCLANGLKKSLNYESLLIEPDKVRYICDLIARDPVKYSRELLNASKSLEQVSFEYNIVDYLKPGARILESDKTSVRIHSLLVQSLYIYEHVLQEKQISIPINEDYTSIRGNFFTLRSAFALLIENCCKYCMSNSDIEIEIMHLDDKVKIDVCMKSVLNSDEEISKMFLPQERGNEASKLGQGTGLGLFIMKQLLFLNGIEVYFKRLNNTTYEENDIKYTNNMFIIDIPRKLILRSK